MGFIKGVKTVFSDVKQFVNQVDCPDEEENAMEIDEKVQSIMNESQRNIDEIEQKYFKSIEKEKQSANKKPSKSGVVETVKVNAKPELHKEEKTAEVEKDGEER